jgi:hypothetical protein
MRRSLILHPDCRCEAVTRIDVAVKRSEPRYLLLEYRVEGAIADLRLPQRSKPVRADELWQHTCFEAFLRGEAGESYFEFNYAPSTEWAAYRFDSYRAGMRPVRGVSSSPRINVWSDASSLTLQTLLVLDNLPVMAFGGPSDGRYLLGLSAVIEEANGRKSYWALAHPPGKPDFHHRDCFALELPRI